MANVFGFIEGFNLFDSATDLFTTLLEHMWILKSYFSILEYTAKTIGKNFYNVLSKSNYEINIYYVVLAVVLIVVAIFPSKIANSVFYAFNDIKDGILGCQGKCRDSRYYKNDRLPAKLQSTSNLEQMLVMYINKLILDKHERCYELCKSLLSEYGTDKINVPTPPENYTAFLRAVWFGPPKLVQYMLQNGACITSRNSSGESAMYLAAYKIAKETKSDFKLFKEKEYLLTWLFEAGCDINAANCKGYTPLHIAAKEGNYFLTAWLLKRHARVDMRTIKSLKRPMDVARQYRSKKHEAIEKILEEYEYIHERRLFMKYFHRRVITETKINMWRNMLKPNRL